MSRTRSAITGQRFGKLVALHPAGKLWLCRCDCGGERIVTARMLNSGQASHCGCATGANRSAGLKNRRQSQAEWAAENREALWQAARKAAIKRPNGGPIDHFLYGHPAP